MFAIGLWLVVIAAVAWMVHSKPDSNRSIRRFRRARRSLAPPGRRHRDSVAAALSSVVVVEQRRPRPRPSRVIDLRERDPEARPARWPADGWSLGSIATSGPRFAWASAGSPAPTPATLPMPLDAPPEPVFPVDRPVRDDGAKPAPSSTSDTAPAAGKPTASAGRPARPPRPAAPRAPLPRVAPQRPLGTPPRPLGTPPRPLGTQARPLVPVAAGHAGERIAGHAGGRPAHAGARPAHAAPLGEPVRRRLDERPHHSAVAQARQKVDGPATWRVIDLTEAKPPAPPAPEPVRITGGRREYEARRWGPTTPLPAVFRLEPLGATGSEGGSRA